MKQGDGDSSEAYKKAIVNYEILANRYFYSEKISIKIAKIIDMLKSYLRKLNLKKKSG